ncbi:protein kinase domain-containing protein [Polyangium spumosum]|uniref:protein kinase domain-containing protein n=1 Tax=Polyangium spumosum TaxID=889282 RepID=UPI0014795716
MGASGCPEHGRPLEGDTAPELSSEPEAPLPEFRGYRTERMLGRGGFGMVYAAISASASPTSPPRRVAIKLARDDRAGAAQRLAHELVALRLVGPPHVPEVIDAGELHPGSPYIVMELVEARTLAEILATRGRSLPPAEACAITRALLGSLRAVHEEGLVHRDIKPENVLVTEPPGRATVLDLGLARRGGAMPARTIAPHEEGAMVGTIEYMAPEQCEGRAELDARADVYAVGVILYEMLAGSPPFWGPPAAVREGHLSRRPARLEGRAGTPIPAELEDIVLRCLEKDPAARYSNATELDQALAAIRLGTEPELRKSPESAGDPTTNGIGKTQAPDRGSSEGGRARPSDASATERRTVALLHFTSQLDPIALQGRIEPIGGHVMRASGGRYVVAFGHEADENPVRLAIRAAQDLVARGICERVWIDLATVSVTARPDGSKRLLAPHLARIGQAPLPAGAAPILLSPAARAVLTEADLSETLSLFGAKAVEEGELSGAEDPTTRLGHVGPPLVGRDDLLETLTLAALRSVREAVPSVSVIVGEPGHGKSHLRRLLVERLRTLVPLGAVVDLRAPEPIVGGGDSVRDLLSAALGLPASMPIEGRKAALRERLGPASSPEAEAALALALGWVGPPRGDETTDFPGLRALEAAPFALGATLRVAGGEALRRRAERTPLCVVLDDAQFADEATLGILEHATLAEARAPIFVCALGRPVFRENHPSWAERAAHRDVCDLGPLDEQSAASLVRVLLAPAENVPELAVRRLVERTQGIPLLLVELVRGLKGAGIVRRHEGGRGFYVATDELDRVPDLPLIEWLAHREIDALSPAERAHARLVATVGAEVTPEEISGILRGILRRLDQSGESSEFPLDARIGIERLLNTGVLRRQRHGRVSFRHALVRETIARGVPEALRRKIHLTCAEYYRDAPGFPEGPPEEQRLPQLAYHAAAAGLRDVAESAYMALAEAARARHAYVDAERFYTLALEQQASTGQRRGGAYRGRGLMRYRVGRYHDALADFAEARAAASAAGDEMEIVEILLDEATALDWMGEHVDSREKVHAAQALVAGRATPLLSARMLLGIGRSHYRFSLKEEALDALARAASEAARLGEGGYETQVIALLMLGYLEQGIGRHASAERALDRAVTLCDAHGDALHLAASINTRGVLRGFQGDRQRMVSDLARVISLGRELGQDYIEWTGHFNLGECLYLMAELDAAEPHVAQARALSERPLGVAPRPASIILQARMMLYRGDIENARALASRARGETSEPLTVPSDDVLCSMIELAAEDAGEEAWEALEARSERYSIGQERIEVVETRGLSALRRGRRREAARHLERALALSRQIPNVIGKRLARHLAEATRD